MIVIINYGIGNLVLIYIMLKKSGISSLITNNRIDVQDATKLFHSGMEHFGSCKIKRKRIGLKEIIENRVFQDKIPGIF